MTDQLDLSLLTDFHLVASERSFRSASRTSGRSKATLSRRIADFESRLGVRLFERSERGLMLTEAGEELRSRTSGPLEQIGDTIDLLPNSGGALRGTLRISSAVVFAHTHLVGVAARFMNAHPDLRIEIVADDRMIDPVAERFDIVVRANPDEDERLVGRCVVRTDRVAVAAPTLGRPMDGGRAALLYRLPEDPASSWRLRDGGDCWECGLRPAIGFSSLLMIRQAALAGAGVALLPRTLIGPDLAAGTLASWGTLDGASTSIWVLQTSRRFASPKVMAFVACLMEEFADDER